MSDLVMKPYFDKLEEINKKYIVNTNILELRLQRLKDDKDIEFNKLISQMTNEGKNFYNGYDEALRERFEAEYNRQIQILENELNDLKKFYKVDIRELTEIKSKLRKRLFALSRVLTEQLDQIQESLKLTELSKEETAILMASMTPLEKEEYDSRKQAYNEENEIKAKIAQIITPVFQEYSKTVKVPDELTNSIFAENPEIQNEIQTYELLEPYLDNIERGQMAWELVGKYPQLEQVLNLYGIPSKSQLNQFLEFEEQPTEQKNR